MINKHDEEIKKLYQKILEDGVEKTDRTGVGTKSIFGYQMRFKMSDGFPLLTLRKIHTKSLVHELLWFLESYDEKYNEFGNTNIRYLLENNVTFWTEWPYDAYRKIALGKYLDDDLKDDKTIKKLNILSIKEFEEKIINDDYFALKYGDLGPVYGHQWKNFGGYTEKAEITKQYEANRNGIRIVDSQGWEDVKMEGINQIDNVIEQLLEDPDSRRIIVNSWNASEIDDMMLPPCHMMFQFYTSLLNDKEKEENPGKERKLSLQLYQRSGDFGLGIPYNVGSYSLLLHMIAQVVNMVPNEFVWTGGDVHIYNNHLRQLDEMFQRDSFKPCKLVLNPNINNIYDFRYEDITFENYESNSNIKMDVAV
jgi:thymidylate synthase